MIVIKGEVRRKKSGEVVVKGRRSRVMVVKGGGWREEVEEKHTALGAPPLQAGFPWQGASGWGRSPRESVGVGEHREGDSLAPGLRPGSLDSSQK